MRVGLGYDIHRFASEDRRLMLGGVHIPGSRGLAGHSDADVVVHALCDALLGALSLGDIGDHFPDTDPQFKDIDSLNLLRHVVGLTRDRGYRLENADITIQAQEPRVGPFKEAMRKVMSEVLGCDPTLLNIKATTLEGLGALGQGEGIAAFATVLLEEMG
jgi:2-C-methyl-D-erythritol 2,4-cyclodiphosphate synthase